MDFKQTIRTPSEVAISVAEEIVGRIESENKRFRDALLRIEFATCQFSDGSLPGQINAMARNALMEDTK